jgi:kinesin family protein C2/C3
MRAKLRDEISVRRKLHNLVMELKGNIRVFARIRPQSQAELNNGDPACVSAESDTELLISRAGQHRKFTFDRVFDCATANNEVFTDIQQLLVSTLDGFNVCVLTYGITGSGKTYTMQGIFERVGIDLFEQKVSRERFGGWTYALELAVYEIYNETVIDLLNLKNLDTNPRISSTTGYFHIPGITTVSIESPSEIQKLLQDSSRNRSVSSTNCNEQSSRSHLIVTIFFRIGTPNNKELRSKLTLVDLAGSERLDKSGASGQTAKEAVHINKSLSALGDVISARVNKASHVPYRNSTLTTVLQECLVGDSKTLMILQINPAIHAVEETMNSLIFASRIREVETFKPLNSPRRR